MLFPKKLGGPSPGSAHHFYLSEELNSENDEHSFAIGHEMFSMYLTMEEFKNEHSKRSAPDFIRLNSENVLTLLCN